MPTTLSSEVTRACEGFLYVKPTLYKAFQYNGLHKKVEEFKILDLIKFINENNEE